MGRKKVEYDCRTGAVAQRHAGRDVYPEQVMHSPTYWPATLWVKRTFVLAADGQENPEDMRRRVSAL